MSGCQARVVLVDDPMSPQVQRRVDFPANVLRLEDSVEWGSHLQPHCIPILMLDGLGMPTRLQ